MMLAPSSNMAAGSTKSSSQDIYSYAPTDRNIGGTNIKQIETDFGNIGIALNRFMPQTAVLAVEMSAVRPVFQPVPGKGNFFYEELAKTGASEKGQIFGQISAFLRLHHRPDLIGGSNIGGIRQEHQADRNGRGNIGTPCGVKKRRQFRTLPAL